VKTYEECGLIGVPAHGTGEHAMLCPQCSASRKKNKDKCLWVNLDKRTWNCFNCNWKGGLGPDRSDPFANSPKPVPKAPPEPVDDVGPLSDKAYAWLKERGIDFEAANTMQLGSCSRYFRKLGREAEALAAPFHRESKIVNYKFRCIEEKDFTQQEGGQACLYGFDQCVGEKTVILTEGEVDVWTAMTVGYSGACSCPSGAGKVGEAGTKLEFLLDAKDIFDHADKVILAMDHDEAGVPFESAIADRIGREKCWTCFYPGGCCDLNEVLLKHGEEAVSVSIETARPVPVSGLTTFLDHSEDILAYFKDGGLSRGLSTGWECVDRHMRLRPGTLAIVTGVPSSGKSEWLDQLMLNTMRLHGWKWCVFSPENMPLPYHLQKLAEKLIGKPMFEQYSVEQMTRPDVEHAVEYLSERITFIAMDEKGMDLEGIMSRARVCAVRHGIKGFILDPYNEVEHQRGTGVTESEYISKFLSTVRIFGRLYGVAMFIVAHPTKLQKKEDGTYPVPTPYDISGSANWRNKADLCVTVDRGRENTVQVHVQKVRDKNLGETGATELHWQRATGLFFESEAELRQATQQGGN